MASKINSKQKGKRGELEFVHVLEEWGFTARRSQQFMGTPDSADVLVEETPYLHWEVKRVQKLNLVGAVDKAIKDSGNNLSVVAHRHNRGRWLCTMDVRDFLDLIVDYTLLKQKESRSKSDAYIYTERTWNRSNKKRK